MPCFDFYKWHMIVDATSVGGPPPAPDTKRRSRDRHPDGVHHARAGECRHGVGVIRADICTGLGPRRSNSDIGEWVSQGLPGSSAGAAADAILEFITH